jgi:hypothetical protein
LSFAITVQRLKPVARSCEVAHVGRGVELVELAFGGAFKAGEGRNSISVMKGLRALVPKADDHVLEVATIPHYVKHNAKRQPGANIAMLPVDRRRSGPLLIQVYDSELVTKTGSVRGSHQDLTVEREMMIELGHDDVGCDLPHRAYQPVRQV